VDLNDQQRTRITESVTRLNVQPLTNVNFSVAVGSVLPGNVRVQILPPEVVEIVPQYRGYNFFMVRDEIVIVEPSTLKIVSVIPRPGSRTTAAPAPERKAVNFTDQERQVIKRHASRPRTEARTTTTTAPSRTMLRRGERVPETIEIEEIPETVYREAPTLREYRYLQRDNRTYVVDPRERMIIDEID